MIHWCEINVKIRLPSRRANIEEISIFIALKLLYISLAMYKCRIYLVLSLPDYRLYPSLILQHVSPIVSLWFKDTFVKTVKDHWIKQCPSEPSLYPPSPPGG